LGFENPQSSQTGGDYSDRSLTAASAASFNPPSTLLGTYPTVLIPAFAVPLSLMLHALSLRQLARLQRNQALHGQA